MTTDYETGRNNIEVLRDWYKEREGQRNEATTRVQLIDRLFFECLGWSRDDCIAEEPYGQEYTDYTFLAPRRVLIVEAKKEGNYFELPAGRANLEYAIQSLCRDYPNLKAAIEQVSRYCQLRGVPFAAVSNGHQIVAFVATRSDGLPPLDGHAIVFPTIDFMVENFLALWQALSKLGVEQKNLQATLVGTIGPKLPPKLSSTITNYPGIRYRNVFQADLQTLSELIIEDLVNSAELSKRFLTECYSKSGALSQYALVSKNILHTRYAALFAPELPGPTIVPAVNRDGISAELLAESLSRRPIILLGDVGVGKTTFIRYLINVEAAPLFENVITFYINLGSQATLTYDLREFLLDEIIRQLLKTYNLDVFERNFVHGVYHSELDRFSRGIYSDLKETNPDLYALRRLEFLEQKINNKEQHLKQVILHVAKARRKQVVIFIDNSDQRDESTQQQAFLIAQELAEHWKPMTVFLSIRPETFYRSQRIGALSGYHPKAFTIQPPRIDRVIEKRLAFALKLTSGEIPIESLTAGITVQLESLGRIINVFLRSLAYNDDLAEFIDNIAGGNVRLALDLIRNFFGSGHVDTQKIVQIEQETNRYVIPLHEFLRAVLYGDANNYDPEQSPIANLFDISHNDANEHFLLPLLIGLLATSKGSTVEEGFIDTSVVYEQLQGLGFLPDQIDDAVIRGIRKKLFEAAARRIPHPGGDMPQALRITSVGHYHTSRLCRFFPYLDAIVVDTPILDSDFRKLLHDERDIAERVQRADIFRQYLDKQWATLKTAGASFLFDWDHVSEALKTDIANVRARIR